MTEEVTYYLSMCLESDIPIESSLGKTEGDIIINLVMSKIIFQTKKFFDKWIGQNVSTIIFIIEFLHLPYSNYVRNYARDIFHLLLSESFCIPISNLVIIRNAIEESYEKNPIVYDDNVDLEKILEFSIFLSETFSSHSDKIEKYEKENPIFKSKYVSRLDNISGSLIGTAIGESVGFLVEGHSPDSCYEYVDKIIVPKLVHLYGIDKDMGRTGKSRYCRIDENTASFQYGQYTIDTQSSREMLLSIENGVFNVDSFKKRMISLYGLAGLIEWDKNNISKTSLVGTPELSFVENIKKGVPYKEEKNDPCARVAPLGSVYMSRKDICKTVSSSQASMTNSSETVIACSILVAEATRLALENKIKPYSKYNILNSPHIFCKQLSNAIMSINPTLGTYVSSMPVLITKRKNMIKDSKLEYILASALADRQIIKIITSETAKMFGEPLLNEGEIISSSPVQSCLFSIYCLICVPDFFVSCICMAIRSGGDTSSIAAIVGGMVGTRVGLKSIPSYFVDKINDQGYYKSDELINLCKNLCEEDKVPLNTFPTQQLQPTTFGTQQPSTFGTQQPSTFGTQLQPNTFGTQLQPSTFGTQQPSTFGTQQPSTFGTQQPSTFGTQQPSTFGTQQQPNTFGTQQQPSTFGTQQPSTFGTQQPSTFVTQQPPNTFGTQQPPNTFGTQQQPNTFGTQQPPNTFGTQQPPNTFGTQPPNTFGTQPPNTFGTQQQPNTFGTQQPPSTFGTQPPNTFGTQQQPNTFGTQQPPSTFGTQQPPSTFGTQPRPNTFGTQPPSTFGTQPPSTFVTQPPSTFGTQQPPSTFGTQKLSAFGTQQQPSTFGTQPTTFKAPSANPLTYNFGSK
jgi:ADP-ribosylglycohydrolase